MLSHSTNPTLKGQTHSYEGLLCIYSLKATWAFLYHCPLHVLFSMLFFLETIFPKNYRVQVALSRTVLDATLNAI
jgi:hypothetical protein